MKRTMLQLTQDILYSMDGEEISSVQDNYESRQVAQIIYETFLNIVPQANLPDHWTMFELQAPVEGVSASWPTILRMPLNCTVVDYIAYDCHLTGVTDPLYTGLKYLSPPEFFSMMTKWSPSSDTTITKFTYTINGNSMTFEVSNNRPPVYWTSWDDVTISLDAYDSAVDTYSTPSKTQVFGKLDQTATISDALVLNLTSEQFPLLLQEAKALAWAQMKQTTHAKAEHEAKRQWRHLGQSKYTGPNYLNHFQSLPNYGRTSGSGVSRVLRSSTGIGDGDFTSGFSSGFEK